MWHFVDPLPPRVSRIIWMSPIDKDAAQMICDHLWKEGVVAMLRYQMSFKVVGW